MQTVLPVLLDWVDALARGVLQLCMSMCLCVSSPGSPASLACTPCSALLLGTCTCWRQQQAGGCTAGTFLSLAGKRPLRWFWQLFGLPCEIPIRYGKKVFNIALSVFWSSMCCLFQRLCMGCDVSGEDVAWPAASKALKKVWGGV